MDTRPACSIIMGVYNEDPQHLSLAIDSMLQQSFEDFEYIIINDCPWNQELATLLEHYERQDTRILYLKNKKNQWLAATLNIGIKHALWSYIVRMDGDDIAFPQRLEVQYQYMLEHPSVDFLWSSATMIDREGNLIKDLIIEPLKAEKIRTYFFETRVLIHPTIIGKASTFKKYLYDPLFVRSQDLELWLRVMGTCRFAVTDTPLLYYRTPTLWDYRSRISKMRRSTQRWLKAFCNNIKPNKTNLAFWYAYLRRLLLYLILRFPIQLLVYMMRIKDFIVH